jgi:NAD(P)-dependent dehydrogenase (short-subunit alcohol dehydrogenase family)
VNATVVITGGTGGLGTVVTQTMLEAGWNVVVPYKDERELEHVNQHERLELVEADLFDPAAATAVIAKASGNLGALVNLVGGFSAAGRVHETPIEDFEQQFQLTCGRRT